MVDSRFKVIDFYLFVRGDNRMYECPVFHTRDRGSSSSVFLSTLRILVKQSDPRSGDELGLQIESSSSGWILSNVALVMHADNRRI